MSTQSERKAAIDSCKFGSPEYFAAHKEFMKFHPVEFGVFRKAVKTSSGVEIDETLLTSFPTSEEAAEAIWNLSKAGKNDFYFSNPLNRDGEKIVQK